MADEFLTALQGLGKAVQSFAQSQNFADANTRAQQIRTQMAPGVEQRQAMIALADDTFLRLAQGGMDPSAAAAVRNNLLPKNPDTAVQASLLGALNGDAAMQKVGNDLQQEEEARKLRTLNQQFENQFTLTERLEEGRDNRAAAQNQRLLEVATQRAAAHQRPLPTPVATQISAIDEAKGSLQTILSRLESDPDARSAVGPVRGVLGSIPGAQYLQSAQSTAFQAEIGRVFDQYRHTITGAAASASELRMLQQNSISANDTPAALVQKLKNLMAVGERTKASKLDTFRRVGYDVSGFAAPDVGFKADAGSQSTAAGSPAVQVNSFFKADR